MTFPIEPIMNDMSQFNRQQHVVTQDLNDARTFIQAFAQRLRCFSKSSQAFESSQSVQDLYDQLMVQFHVFDYCFDDLGWLLLLQTNVSHIKKSHIKSYQALPLLGAVKQCYHQIHTIGNESFQDLLLSLKGALHLIQQHSEVIAQRHAFKDNTQDLENDCFSVSSHLSMPLDSSDHVINFLTINPHVTPELSTSSSDLHINQDGSVNLSNIRAFIVDSLFHYNQEDAVYLECPVMFTECPKGTEMAILYDSQRIDSIHDLFEHPQKHYCFSVLAAEQILAMNGMHPLTRESVDSLLIVKLDSFDKDSVKSSNQDLVFFDKKIQNLIQLLVDKTDDLLDLFDDMVAETLPLHQHLERLVHFINGHDGIVDETVFDFDSLEKRLHAMKQFHLALEYQKSGLFESIGYSDLLGNMVHSIGILYQDVSQSYERHSNVLLSLHKTGLDGLARDLHDVIIQASEHFPEHNDIYGELYDLHVTVKKLIYQLEQRLSIYRQHLERLLALSHPDHIETQLIKECEIMITRLSQQLASVSSGS